jgi:hypothetical protein
MKRVKGMIAASTPNRPGDSAVKASTGTSTRQVNSWDALVNQLSIVAS